MSLHSTITVEYGSKMSVSSSTHQPQTEKIAGVGYIHDAKVAKHPLCSRGVRGICYI